MKNERSVSIKAGGGGSPEPATEWHPQCNPGEKLNVILNSERSERDSGPAPHCELVSKLSSRTRFGIWPTLLVVSHSGQMLKQVQHDKSVLACVGFTMAEILLSLTIIGVVAAITLPSLTGNINERTWNTQRKALYARFSQAMSLMPSLNGIPVQPLWRTQPLKPL